MGRYLLSQGPQAAGVSRQAERVDHGQDPVPAGRRRVAGFLEASRRACCRPTGRSSISAGPGSATSRTIRRSRASTIWCAWSPRRMDGPVDLVAQSMGGIIAARLAIEQPQNVRRLVLTVTSGGVDMAGLGASDWREGYRKSFPRAACLDHRAASCRSAAGREDRGADVAAVGRCDPISPVAVGRHLAVAHPGRASAHRRRRRSRSGAHACRRGGAADRAPSRLIRRSAGVPAG